MLLERAERAGAQIEKTRVTGHRRETAPAGSLRTTGGNVDADYCIVATGARNPLREVGTELTPRDAMSALGYYVPGDQEQNRHSVSAGAGRLHLGISAMRPSFGGHLRQGRAGAARCVSGWKQYMDETGDLAGRARRLQPPAASLETAGWKRNRVAGDGWMAVGDAAGLVDPITGEGLYYAMRSARPGGQALLSEMPADWAELQLPQAAAPRFRADLEFGSRLAKRCSTDDFYSDGHQRGWCNSPGSVRVSRL